MSIDFPIACPIIAIGASAGGLKALGQLLDTVPADTGAAFVIVTHLDPNHRSHLVELLTRHCAMPVTEVLLEAVTPILRNHVYLIPPSKFLSVTAAGLQAVDPAPNEPVRKPIDRFLNAMAEGGYLFLGNAESVSPQHVTEAGIDDLALVSQFEEELASAPEDLRVHVEELSNVNAQLKAKVDALQHSYDYASTIIDTVREPFLVLDQNFVVQSANRSFYEKFAVTPDETRNRLVYELGDHQWDSPTLRELLEEVLPKNDKIENFLLEQTFPSIGARSFLLNVRHLAMPGDEPARILLAFEDTTEREATKQLKRNAETFTRLVDESPFGIYVVDSNFRMARVSRGGRAAFRKVKPLIGRDFSEAIHILWPEELANEIVRLFRRTLSTGEPYVAPSLTAKRLDVGDVESYEWQIHRVTLPDGAYGVVCYFFDSSDIRAAEQAAHKSEQRALRANRTKSEFLAHVSHEIRTPMSAVLGYAELLLNQLKNNEYLNEVRIIKSSGESLLRLVDDLLDLSSIEAGKLQIEPDRCELDALLAEVVSQVQMRCNEKNLNLTLDYVGTIPRSIETDAGRVQQILLNLLSNAIKFTDQGNIVLCVTYIAEPTPVVRFDVTDTGKGMSVSRQKKLFQPFERAFRRDFGGSGLGLYISHSLAERLRGTLTVESKLHHGSKFTLTIPAGTSSEVELVIPRRTFVIPKSIAELSARLSGKHILIADDQPAVRELLKQFVESAGGKVTSANNGQMALDSMADDHKQTVDAIILDLQMPVMDGLTTVKTLRQGGSTVPIIAITANTLHSNRRQCLAAGFDAFMNKPIVGKALISKLHQLIEGKAQRRVLVVDDAPESADPLSRLLRIRGFDVQTVYDGASVQAAVDAFSPDAILLDISLPDMDGYQVADLIQQRPDSSEIELIALTGHNTESARKAIRMAGFSHHLVKPVDIEQLLLILKRGSLSMTRS